MQVLYRGKLGSEDDAVVVATKDVSEPTFATFANTTDYVVLNGAFYTPGQLAAQQGLFAGVTASCRSGLSGSFVVSPSCYNVSDYFTFVAGTSGINIAAVNDTKIAARRLARVALITDRDSSPQLGWQTDAVSCWVFLGNPITVLPYEAQMNDEGGWFYDYPSALRSVKVWDGWVCYSDVGIARTDPHTLDYSQLDDLQSPTETSPTPLTITGWD